MAAALVRLPLLGAKPIVTLMACGVVFSIVYLAAVLMEKIPTAEEIGIVRGKLVALLARAR